MGTTHAGGKIGNLKSGLTGLLGVSALAAVTALGSGCQNKLYDENSALRQQNRELQARLDERAQIQSAAPIADIHMPEAVRPVTPPPAPVPTPPAAPLLPPVPDQPAMPSGTDLAGLDTTENKVTGTMTVKFLGDELFDPGLATLKDSSKKDLNKVAAALKKQYAGKPVRVEGHTDSDPIKRSKWSSNMELSKARADAVAKYLETKGIDATRVSTQGFGDTKLKTNDPSQKGQNRRVEIVVLAR